MLKKISHIILSALLLVSTMGLVVSKHYCSGSLISVSVFHEAKSCCGDSDCCHNENQVYQVKDDFSVPVVMSNPVLAELDILSSELNVADWLISPEQENSIVSFTDSPPPPSIQKVLSLKQVYRL